MSLEEALQEGQEAMGPSDNDDWDDVKEDPELADGPQPLRIQQIEHRQNKKGGTRLNILLTYAGEGEYKGIFQQLNLPFPGQKPQPRKFSLLNLKQFATLFRVSLPPSKDDAEVMANHAIENWTNAEANCTVMTEVDEYEGKETRNKVIRLPKLKS